MGILSFTFLLPFLTALGVIFTPAKETLAIKRIALVGTLGSVALSLLLLYFFPRTPLAEGEIYKFIEIHSWIPQLNIYYRLGVDGISVTMILLTSVVIFCGVLASWGLKNRVKEFFALLLLLVTGVFGAFVSTDLFLFFFFYEIAVLPMYLLIGVWGTGQKEYSAMKLTLMLMAGSALILVGILALYFFSGSLPGSHSTFSIAQLANLRFSGSFQNWVFPCLFIGFGIIGALFPLHSWSPDGHSSAPTAVSMLHAGVLMKLGGYGCLRVVYMLPEGARAWAIFFLALSTINIIYGALVAIQKRDLKYITAYSSVSHCGFVLFGLMALTPLAARGAVLQMFSHGVMTALFFALIGMIYERTHTRDIDRMGGLMDVMPFLGVSYFVAGFAALGLPGLSGFIAEFTIFMGAWSSGAGAIRFMTLIAMASIVVSAVYILRALGAMFFGPNNPTQVSGIKDANNVERIPIIVLISLLLLVGLYPSWLNTLIDSALGPIFINLGR